MRFESRTFWLAKDLDEPGQCQDAFALDAEQGIASCADGVSSAIFSGPWARILVQSTVESPPRLDDADAFRAWLDAQRAAWRDGIDMARLTWYQRPKMVDGAMTTLLWTELTPTQTADDGHATSYQLRAVAIGDTCLFHLRGDECLKHFPMDSAGQFGLNPAVIGSVDRQADHLLEFQLYEAECPPGDWLVLATDALALWAMTRGESGEPVDWRRYWDLPDDEWRQEIVALREANLMRYDDTTLVLLRVIEERPAPIEQAPPEVIDSAAETGVPLETTPVGDVDAASAPVCDAAAISVEDDAGDVPAIVPREGEPREDQVEPVALAEAVESPAAVVERPAPAVEMDAEDLSRAIAAGMESTEELDDNRESNVTTDQ